MLQLNIFLGEEEDCEEEEMAGEAGGGFGLYSDRVATLELKQTKKKKNSQSMKGSFPRDCLFSAYLHLLAKRSHGRTDAEGDMEKTKI